MKKFLLFFLLISFLGCAPAAKNVNSITVWHWMTDRQDAFVKLSQQYEKQTGVKVTFELYAPSDAYSQKVIASAQAHVLPDIFGILGEKETFASFVKNGFVADLTEDFKANNDEWENSFFPKTIAGNRFTEGNVYKIKPGIYGVPIDVTNIQMLYNKKLLAQAGIEHPPESFQEFLRDIQALKRIGMNGFVSGWGEAWMINCFASNYAFNILGEEKIMATYRGEVPYTDPGWIQVFTIFKTLADEGALAPGIVTKGNKFAEQDFALERAAFAFNGSWCVNVYKKMNPSLQYGAMIPPKISDAFPMKIWGGVGSSFVVNNISKKRSQAIDFLKWFTAKEQQAYVAAETKNLPANHQELSFIDPVLSNFAKGTDSATHPSVWEVNEYPEVIERFAKGIQSIIIEDKTPKEVAEEVQALKEKIMERESRRKK